MVKPLAIIGSGPAGLTAAIYASRDQLEPMVFAGPEIGGQLTTTTEVENFPGFPEGIQGPELMTKIQTQAVRFGAEIINESVIDVVTSQNPFIIKTDKQTYSVEAIIISSGSSARWLGLPNETRLRGYGVSACATCDAFFFKGKEVVVVGGGDVAMEDATYLTKFATKVTVIHRRDTLRASKPMEERAKNNPKIEFIWNSEVIDVLGEQTVSGVRIKNVVTGETSNLVIQGLFIAIGHDPNTKYLTGKIDLDEKGYVVKDPNSTKTSIPGIFVAGDVHDHIYQQAVMAAGFGCQAALDVERYLAEKAS